MLDFRESPCRYKIVCTARYGIRKVEMSQHFYNFLKDKINFIT